MIPIPRIRQPAKCSRKKKYKGKAMEVFMKNKCMSIIAVLTVLLFMCACTDGGNTVQESAAPASKQPEKTEASDNTVFDNVTKAEIEMQNGDLIKLDLYPDAAPITVENFVKLADSGFYDNLIFHRVISGFMIQGGGYNENMEQPSKADTIKGEFEANGVKNSLKHTRGVISMARTSQSMDSASSQFFIMHSDAPHLDGQYAAFGKVTEGMDVVDKIAAVKTEIQGNMSDVPSEPQIIKTIRIVSE